MGRRWKGAEGLKGGRTADRGQRVEDETKGVSLLIVTRPVGITQDDGYRALTTQTPLLRIDRKRQTYPNTRRNTLTHRHTHTGPKTRGHRQTHTTRTQTDTQVGTLIDRNAGRHNKHRHTLYVGLPGRRGVMLNSHFVVRLLLLLFFSSIQLPLRLYTLSVIDPSSIKARFILIIQCTFLPINLKDNSICCTFLGSGKMTCGPRSDFKLAKCVKLL